MFRLNSRILGKQTSLSARYVCRQCRKSRTWSSQYNSVRGYHGSPAAFDRLKYRPSRRSRFEDEEEDSLSRRSSSKGYGRVRRYKKVEDDYPEEELRDFDTGRYQGRDSQPDLQAIMANARDSDFSKALHKLRREEMEERDPALQILKHMEKPNTFQDSSLRPIMKKALQKSYPNATFLSQTQKNMLLLLQEGYSICATGPPGSGKSFTTALWLLQLMRSTRPSMHPNGRLHKTPTTTGIIFVPSLELMYQYTALLDNLFQGFLEPGKPSPPKETVFQSFGRFHKGTSAEETKQMRTLAQYPNPHLIVTTPLRFLDILNDPDSKDLVDLENIKVIVADEVDAMINQRPAPKRLEEIKSRAKKIANLKWTRPTPLETCIDFLIGKREMMASEAGRKAEQLQFCFISPNLSPVLKSKITVDKGWVEAPQNTSKANTLINLGMQDFSELFNHEKINPIVSLPSRIKHYALSVDMSTGLMRDIPSYDKDILIRSKEEQAEIEKYVHILNAHHDPRSESMSNKALMVEAAQEGILVDEEGGLQSYKYYTDSDNHGDIEIKDVTTEIQSDFRNIGIPRNVVVEILDTLLARDNFPERVIMYIPPSASRQKYVDTLRDAGFRAEQFRYDTVTQHGIQLGRSDLPAPKPKANRTKEDSLIWVASNVNVRGVDTPHFTHAYIMIPVTGYQKYNQMAGRIARYPFPKQVGQLKEPQGQVTTIFLEEPVHQFKHSPFVDGVIQIDSPVEGLAWRRIHRMYGLCGAKVDKYFGPNEPHGIMMRSAQDRFTMFPEMDEELPWEDPEVSKLSKETRLGPDSVDGSSQIHAKIEVPGDAYEFLQLGEDPTSPASTISEPLTIHPIEEKSKSEDIINTTMSNEEEPAAPTTIASEDTLEESANAVEEAELEIRDVEIKFEESSTTYEPVELQDGPYFAEESADIPAPDIPSETETPSLADQPLEVAEGVTEEEAKEFQAAQDDIFSAFLELNIIQEKMKQSQEAKDSKSNLKGLDEEHLGPKEPEIDAEEYGVIEEEEEVQSENSTSSTDGKQTKA